jgi:hypothetical protein
MQQELGRANERCREQRLVKISEPDVRETLENVTCTLQRSAAHPEPQLVLVIPNDSHSGRGVHWTLRIVHVDVHSQCQSQLSRRNEPAETREEQVRSDEVGKDTATLKDSSNHEPRLNSARR